MRKYTAYLEHKCGRKAAFKNDPACMEMHVKDSKGEIITRCVFEYVREFAEFGFCGWRTGWKCVHNDGKFHKVELSSYMENHKSFAMLNKLWKMKTWTPLAFTD